MKSASFRSFIENTSNTKAEVEAVLGQLSGIRRSTINNRQGAHIPRTKARKRALDVLFEADLRGVDARDVLSQQVERFRKAAARMQDILGHLNDVAVAQHLVRDLLDQVPAGPRQRAAALGAGQVIGWYAHTTAELEPTAVEAWEDFRAVEPFWQG